MVFFMFFVRIKARIRHIMMAYVCVFCVKGLFRLHIYFTRIRKRADNKYQSGIGTGADARLPMRYSHNAKYIRGNTLFQAVTLLLGLGFMVVLYVFG